MNLLNLLLVFAVAISPTVIAVGALRLWHWHRKRRQLRPPLTRALLRSPGEGLRRQIDDLSFDLAMWAAVLSFFPSTLYAIYLSQAHVFKSWFSIWLFITTGTIVFLYAMYRLMRAATYRRRLRQDLDGELATGQELTELLKNGMSVFHDFPAGGFNIDHIIVGSQGVFAVETKTRAKSRTGKGSEEVKVRVEGDTLVFPNWRETRWIGQARRQATWLSDWLHRRTGENVLVRPVLALPGWFVLSNDGDVLVFNPRNRHELVGAPPTNEQIHKITEALEKCCRNVEAYEV